MRAGLLKYQIKLLFKQTSVDEFGSTIENWVIYSTVRAGIGYRGGNKSISDLEMFNSATLDFIVRYDKNITEQMVISFNDKVYKINSLNPNPFDNTLTIVSELINGLIDGAIELNGTSGTDGTSGVNGLAGTSGTSGADGLAGTSGVSGTSGTSGIDGINGTSGVNGTSGIDGINGTSGTSGIDGINGTSGVNGTSGIDGINGTSGVNGINGTSGLDGLAGTSGTSGINGTSGTSGTSGSAIIQVAGLTIAQTGWTLVSGYYENYIYDSNIDSNKVIEVIPDNSTITIVKDAQILPKVVSESGKAKVYSINNPTGNILVDINITTL